MRQIMMRMHYYKPQCIREESPVVYTIQAADFPLFSQKSNTLDFAKAKSCATGKFTSLLDYPSPGQFPIGLHILRQYVSLPGRKKVVKLPAKPRRNNHNSFRKCEGFMRRVVLYSY